MLRNKCLGIDDSWMNVIPQLTAQDIDDGLVRVTAIVPIEVFHILKDECGWLMKLQNLFYFEKKVTLFLIFKPVLAAQTVFL
jgi:hypothetical protein